VEDRASDRRQVQDQIHNLIAGFVRDGIHGIVFVVVMARSTPSRRAARHFSEVATVVKTVAPRVLANMIAVVPIPGVSPRTGNVSPDPSAARSNAFVQTIKKEPRRPIRYRAQRAPAAHCSHERCSSPHSDHLGRVHKPGRRRAIARRRFRVPPPYRQSRARRCLTSRAAAYGSRAAAGYREDRHRLLPPRRAPLPA